MTRNTMMALGALAVLATGCDNGSSEKIEALEARVAELETKVAGKGTQAPPNAPTADPNEQAAAELLKAVQQHSQALEYDKATAKLAELTEKFPQSRAARAAQRFEMELEVIGKEATALNISTWHKGAEVDVTNGTNLLVFWEVWCPHCKREVPKLSATAAKFGDKGLKVVGLTKQTRNITDEQVTDFIDQNEVSYPVGKEDGTISAHYNVRGVPAAAVVKDGKVVWRGHPGRLTDDMIEGWL